MLLNMKHIQVSSPHPLTWTPWADSARADNNDNAGNININNNMLTLLQYVIYIIAFYGIRKFWLKLIKVN